VLAAILPQGPDGRDGRYILRAWQQETRTADGAEEPILLASVVRQTIDRPLGLLSVPMRDDETACDATELLRRLPDALAVGPVQPPGGGACGGQTVLARPQAQASAGAAGRPSRLAVSGVQIR
jgi:hypothetical protein